MAKGFNLTAQINLKGPNNLKPIVADIKRQLGSAELKITPKLDIRASKSISSINTRLKTMNSLLASAKSNTDTLSAAFSNLSTSLASANSNTVNISGTMQKTATSAASTSKNIKQAATAMEEFGKQGFLAIKRFAAFSLVSTTIFSLINAINSGLSAFINFDKQLVKLQQVTGKGAIGLKKLEDQITNLSVGLGVSSESLIEVASTLAQAGLNAEETRIALAALAKTELAPSFDDLASTTEGAIAALRQFELQAGDLEAALGSINAVAAAFAVESSDIITAIQRTGGVFAAASRGISEGKDALNEFIAVFTSVRATTRESAETIATGLRTIFTRIQRGKTIEALKEYGVVLTDLEGKFVGPFEAVKRLSEGLSRLDPRDLRFSQIVEELGGFRQIGKVIPLIQQFSEAQKALKVAQTGQSSLTDAQLTAQKSLANQIAKVREQFLALIRDVGKSATFQAITKIVLNLTSAFISLASAFKPILPFLAVLGTIKGVKAIGEFGTGFFGSFKKEPGSPSTAQSIGSSIGGTISGSKEKEKSATTKLATDAIQANTSAIKALTIAISNLENTIKSKNSSEFFNGGKVLGFNSGGIVPGSGKGDKIPALLEPGEVIINNKAASKYGRDNLVRMNKYALGGPVEATGKVISGTYSSLKSKVQSDALYRAKIRTRPQPTESIKPIMENLKKQNPEYPNWKLFEYAVGKKYGFKVAGGNKFLDFPEDLGEAKFMPPNGTYGQDKETGFIKGNNNETMLAKLIGSDKYRKNTTVTSYYPENISDFRNFVFGGMVQKFKNAGLVEEEYYGQKEVEAAKAARKALKKTIERMFVDKKGRASFAVKRPVSMSENISQADREQFTKEGRIVSNPTTKLEELLTEKIIRTQATAATKSPQTKKKRGVDARLLRNLAKTGIQSDDKQIVEDAENAIKKMTPEQIKQLLMGDLKRAPEGEYLKKEAEYKLDPEFRKITGLDTGVKGGAVKQFEALAKENVTKGIFERASYLDRIPDALGQIQAFRANLVKKLAQEKDPKIQKNLQQYISKANTAIDVIKNKKGTPELPGQVTALSWAVRQSIPGAKELASGGLVQKFMPGGVAESAIEEELNPQELIAWIEELGIPQEVRGLAGGNSYIDQMLAAVATKGKPVTSKEVFSKTFLKSDRAVPYLSTVKDLLEIADANKKKPRIFTAEEKANATKVGLVGMLPFGLNETHYEEIAGKILSIHTATLPKDKVPAILQMRKEIDEVLGRTTQNIFGNPGQNLDDPTKEALGLGNLEGYMIEAILAKAGANPGNLNDRSVDYQMGLGNAANLFGIEPNIPTEIKRDVKSGLSKARANFRNYFAKFASGGFVKSALSQSQKIIKWGKGPNAPTTTAVDPRAISLFSQKSTVDTIEQELSKLGIGSLKFIGSGKDSLAYDAGNSVVKFSPGGLKRYSSNIPEQLRPSFAKLIEGYGVEVMPKVDTKVTESDLEELKKIITSKGYQWGDAAVDNMGKLGNRLVVIDGDLTPLQMSSPSLPTKKFTGGLLSKLSSGGTVPAMVSAGEAFVPPKLAKKIGYGKLHKMNQADRNGMKGFSGGGISVFKGPGSGTSDSIGPIGLPEGSFIIREKATKALGLNKGGMAGGVQRFKVGGQTKKDIVRGQGKVLQSVQEAETVFENVLGDMSENIANIIRNKFKGIEKVVSGQAMSLVKGAPAFSEKTRGMAAASSKASAIGLQITGKKGGATTETVAHETGHLADRALGGGKNFASKTEGTFQFNLVDKIRKDMEAEWKKAGKSSKDIEGYLSTGEELFAEFFAKASPEVRAIITSTTDSKKGMALLADHLYELGTHTVGGLEASDIDPFIGVKKSMTPQKNSATVTSKSVATKVAAISTTSGDPDLQNNIKKMSQVIEERTSTLRGLKAEESRLSTEILKETNAIKQLQAQNYAGQKVSGELREAHKRQKELIQKQESIILQSIQTEESLNQAQKDKTNLVKQARTQQSVASEYVQSTLQTGEKPSFNNLGGNPPGGPPGGPPDDGPFGLGPEDPVVKQRREQNFADQEFFKYKAAQTGTSEAGVKLDLAQKLGKATYETGALFGGRVSEAKTGLVTRRESAMKIEGSIETAKQAQTKAKESGDEEALKAATQQLADANSRLSQETEAILQEMVALRPDLAATEKGMQKLAAGAIAVANDLKSGNLQTAQQTLEREVAGSEKGGGLSDKEKADIARARVSKETGFDAGLLERQFEGKGSSAKLAKQQAFIQSREGQRFGKLAEFAPGLTQKIAGTKVGQGLGKAADFISGKGGKFSKGFAALGGFQGIGSGLAVGSEALKNSGLISKKTLKDTNVAGAFGAVQGAGAMAATGAELGSFAGPIGTIIGGIGGAVIGGIKGFFDAKNAQILNNALEKLTKSSESVDVAFKELAKNDTDKNFKNVQKAFGQQIEASKELESIAFGGNESSATGIGGGAAAGALGGAVAGAWIGSIVPVLGTAIGAAVGAGIGGLVGGITGYMSANQNKANREEALRGRVGVAGSMNESAARMAERQMGRMTTEELGAAQTGGVNIIAEQYKQSAIAAAEAANGTKNLTAAQQKKIGQNAMETAYLDAYMKQRKEAGATDQQISEDILADRKLALESGKKALDSQDEAAKKQALLARATKEVALATENLLDVYRRVGANAQRFSDEIDDMLGGVQGRISSLGGKASVQKVDRSGSERILGNMAAYSAQEVKAATQEMVGKLGGGEEAQALGRQAEAAKFLQDKLPSMLRQTGADPSKIISDLSGELRTMGLGGAAIDKMLAEIETQLGKDQEGGLGTLADEISAGGIDKFSMTAAEAAKTLQNLSKTYNDTLQKSIDLQNQYNEVVMQSNEYLRKAGTIRINAELDLAKALGNSPTLAQLNEPFDFEIRDLTKGLVAGGTTDPAAIAAGIVAKTEQNQKLEQVNKDIQNRGMTGATSGEAGAKLLAEQQKNIAAMGANSVAINEGRQALERLASDGTKAANALAKIEEQQRQIEGLGNRFEKIFTASPEELFKMNKQSAALQAAQVAGPEQFKSRAFRQDAFAGLEQDKEFLTGEEYRKQRGMLMRKSLEAQGFTGQSMIQKGGVNMTVDDFIKRIEGGVNEEDPNVKAYREAVATQVQANEKLAKLNELQAIEIQDAMIGLQVFLSTEFPKILTDAVIAARKDSETKPETTPGASPAEKTKAEADKRYDEAKTKRDKIESQINEERLGISKAKNNKLLDPVGSATEIKQRQNRIKELKAQQAEQTSIMNEADATSAEAERTIETEKKTKAETKAAQLAEEKKTKESTVSSSIEQSQRVREGMSPASIPAPPAPGAQSRREANQARAAELRQELKDIEQRGPQSIQNTTLQQTQATAQVSGAAKPQISPETPVSKPVVEKLSSKEKAKLLSIGAIAPKDRSKEQQETYDALRERNLQTSPVAIARQEKQIDKQTKREEYLLKQKPGRRAKLMTKAEKEAGLEAKLAEKEFTKPDLSKAPTLGTLFGPENTQQVSDETRNAFHASNPQQYSAYGQQPSINTISEGTARVTMQPVQSNLPKPVEYTRQVQAAETGTTPSATKTTETSAQLITLDPASIEGLNTFNTNFGSYVDKLVNFQFPTIPEKIEMVGNHVVDVRVSGAAAFESIEKGMKDMINKAIDDKMTEIWKQTGGAIGNRPGAPPPKGK